MKKLFLAALVCFAAVAQAQVASLCSEAERLVPTPKGKLRTQEEWRKAVKGSNLDQKQTDTAIAALLICGIGIHKDAAKGLELLDGAAQAGDRDAVQLLYSYYSGLSGFAADEAKAMHWLNVGVNNGDPVLQAELGRRYMLGSWVSKDAALAERWMAKAAATGQPEAYVLLGFLHAGNKNYTEAMRWFNLGVAANHPAAYAFLGGMYLEGLGIPADPQEGVRLLKVAAKALPESQYVLGWLYSSGTNVPRNPEEAAKWFRLAAESGNADAQEALANAYESGMGVPQNLEQANIWRKKAADGGSKLAKQKLEEAEKAAQIRRQWAKEQQEREQSLRQAVLDGKPESKLALSAFLELTEWDQPRLVDAGGASEGSLRYRAASEAVERRMRERNNEAVEWLKKAEQQGNLAAAYKLGTANWYGALGLSNEPEGLRLIRSAAAQGHPDAIYWLARAYQQGTGVPMNLVAAYALYFQYEMAQSNGTLQLTSFVPPLGLSLNDQNLQRAQQLAQTLTVPGQFLSVLDGAVAGEGR